MKIISNFKDYYDAVLRHNQDPLPVFVRKNQEVQIEYHKRSKTPEEQEFLKLVSPLSAALQRLPACGYANRGVVAFCGKLHYYYRLGGWRTNGRVGGAICYTLDQIIDALQASSDYAYKEIAKKLLDPNHVSNKKHYWRYSRSPLTLSSWKSFQEKKQTTLPDEVFRSFKSPILLIENDTFEVNPRLNQYNFASQVDPYTAYQELDMFIGNNMVVQEDPNAHMTDDLKRHAKGFDEWSFRKHKTEDSKYRKKHGGI